MFSYEFCEIFKNTFLQGTSGWLLLFTDIHAWENFSGAFAKKCWRSSYYAMYLRFEVQFLLWNWHFLPFLVLLFLFYNKQIISFSWSIHFSITVFIAMHVKLSLYSKNKSLQLLKAIKWDSLETKYGLFFFFSFQTPPWFVRKLNGATCFFFFIHSFQF